MSDERTDRLLRAFLENEARERARGVSLDSLHAALKTLTTEVTTNTAELAKVRDRQDRHARRLRAVEIENERRSAQEPGPDWRAQEITSVDLADVVRAERRRDSEAKHLRRRTRDWIVQAVGALALVILTAIIARLFR